jgi:hypothetical protein
VTENASTGVIPTEIGKLAQLTVLDLSQNQLTGAGVQNTRLVAIGRRAYPKLKKTFLLRRQHSDGTRVVHGYHAARAVRQQIDRYAYFVPIVPCVVNECTTN